MKFHRTIYLGFFLIVLATYQSKAGNVFVSGTVTYDLTGNGFSGDDPPSSGISLQLFRDDGDGVFDPALDTLEQSLPLSVDGTFSLSPPVDGRYFVRQVLPVGWIQTDGPALYAFDVFDGVVYQLQGPVIDTFDLPDPAVSYVISAVDPNPSVKKQIVSSALGGERDVFVEVDGQANPISANGLIGMEGGLGAFVFGSATFPGARAVLQYDGIDADHSGPPAALVNAQGLSSNFSEGNSNDGIRIIFTQLDAGAPGATQIGVAIDLTSPGGSATYTGNISEHPSGGAFVVFIPFTDFTTAGTFDLGQITSAEFGLNTSSLADADFTIDLLDVVRRSPLNLNFANQALPSCLAGCVYIDLNTNGVLNVSEPGIDGVEILLTGTNLLNQVVSLNQSTANGGEYSFCDLLPGTYRLVQIQPAGYVDAEETLGLVGGIIGPDEFSAIQLPPNTNATGYYFGERLSADLELTKSGPTLPVAGGESMTYTIQIRNLGPSIAPGTVVTDDLPSWFTLTSSSLPAVTSGVDQVQFMLGEVEVDGLREITITGTLACCLPFSMTNLASVVSLAAETNLTNNIDQEATTLITDTTPPVITRCIPDVDLGCNPTQIPAPDLSQIIANDACSTATISHGGDQTSQTGCRVTILRTYVATDSCGNTASCIQQIRYTVDTTPPQLIGVPASTTVPCTNIPSPAVVSASDACDILPIQVGFNEVVQPGNCPGNYTLVRTWSATDACGNTAESSQTITVVDTVPPIIQCPPGPFVMWADCGLPTATVTNLVPIATAFDVCSPPTIITQSPPPGSTFTGVVEVVLTATDACGLTSTCSVELVQPAFLGNRIWIDENVNGRQDDGEPNLPGVVVQLLDDQEQVIGSTVTDDQGLYRFCVAPGTYCVQVVLGSLPPGYVITVQGVGDAAGDSSANPATGRTQKTTLGPGDENITLDIGVFETTCIGDTVWIDLNRDGIPETENLADAGLPGVRVVLCRVENGIETQVAETITSAVATNRGYYVFKDFPPGEYCVKLDRSTIPARYDESTTPMTYCFTLAPGGISLTNDFGVIEAPTAIRLESFAARATSVGVVLDWETGSEWNNLGYLVYRSERLNGARSLVTPFMIEGQGTGAGATYRCVDPHTTPGRWFYWLEDIEAGGETKIHGPAVAMVRPPFVEQEPLASPVIEGLPSMVLFVQHGDRITLPAGINIMLRAGDAMPRCQIVSGPNAGRYLKGTEITIPGERAHYLAVDANTEVDIFVP